MRLGRQAHTSAAAWSSQVMKQVSRVRSHLGSGFKAPRFAVLGNQSSGKSSLLAALTGLNIFPVGAHACVTKRPLELNLRPGPVKFQFGEYGRTLSSIEAVQEELVLRNEGALSADPIELTLQTPDMPYLMLVDLPGYFSVTTNGVCPEDVVKINQPYVDDPLFTKLLVLSAATDRMVSLGLEHLRRAGQMDHAVTVLTKMDHAVTVLTKMDLAVRDERSAQAFKQQLHAVDLRTGLGVFGVKLRTHQDMENRVTPEAAVKSEQRFLARFPSLRGECVGIPALREKMQELQLDRVRRAFPDMIAQLQAMIDTETGNQGLLDQLSTQRDTRDVAQQLQEVVTSLHPYSPDRAAFERELHAKIRLAVVDCLAPASGVSLTADAGVSLTPDAGVSLTEAEAKETEARELRRLPHDDLCWRWALLQQQLGVSERTELVERSVSPLIYGAIAQPLDLREETRAALQRAAVSAMFVPCLDTRERAHQWNRQLEQAVQAVAKVLPDRLYELTLAHVKEVVRSHSDDPQVAAFFNYTLQRILDNTEWSSFRDSVQQLLNRECRPLDDLTVPKGKPEDVKRVQTKPGFVGSAARPQVVAVYGPEWTHVYFYRVLTPRLADDLFRMTCVNLVKPLFVDVLEQALKFFQRKDLTAEKQAVQDKIVQLRQFVADLQQHQA